MLKQKLTEIADILLKENPCRFRGNACLVGDPSPCCEVTRFSQNGCPYSQDHKCTNPNLECKIWFCLTCWEQMDDNLKKAFLAIEEIAKIYKLISPPYLGRSNYVGADKPKNS